MPRRMHRNTTLALATLVVAATITVLADHVGFGGPTYSVSGAPRAVVAADLDLDGNADFASADMHSDTVTLYRGDGRAAFTSWAVLPLAAGAGPFDIAAADLNRDAAPDLIVANADNGTVTIFFGSYGRIPGDAGRVSLPVRISPRGLATADFNRDGNIDVAVTGAACHCVALLRNDGGHLFSEVARVGGLGSPHGIAVGDFNRDDIPDLAVASSSAGVLDVLVADGRFGFTRQRYGPAPATRAVAVFDYDRDGWSDIVTANTTTSTGQPVVSVFRNTRGAFEYAPQPLEYMLPGDRRSVVVVNVNGDGWPDLAVSVRDRAQVQYLAGGPLGLHGVGSTEDTSLRLGGARGLSVAYLNDDAKPDMVVANEYDGSVTVLRNYSEWSTDWQ